jgi:hypothetical protein
LDVPKSMPHAFDMVGIAVRGKRAAIILHLSRMFQCG